MISLYRQCDQGMAGRVWPDGRAYLDQPVVLIDAFSVIGNALHRFDPNRKDR